MASLAGAAVDALTDAKARGMERGMSLPSMGSITRLMSARGRKAAFGRAKAAFQITRDDARKARVRICGEIVQIQDDDFVSSGFERIVRFSDKYFPELVVPAGAGAEASAEAEEKDTPAQPPNPELDAARAVFAKLFQEGSKFDPKNPLPPCSADDMSILKVGLANRLDTLSADMDRLRQRFEDTTELRAKWLVFENIKDLLEDLMEKERNGDCIEYAEDGNFIAQATKLDVGIEEKFERLLRSAAILILHAEEKAPTREMEEYEPLTDPALEVVQILDKAALTNEDTVRYIETWQQLQAKAGDAVLQLPAVVAETVEEISKSGRILTGMVEERIKAIYGEVIAKVAEAVGGVPDISDRFTALLTEINKEEPVAERLPYERRMYRVVEWVLGVYKEQFAKVEEARVALKACEEARAESATRVAAAEAALAAATTAAADQKAASDKTIGELQGQLAESNESIASYKGLLAGEEERSRRLVGEMAAAQAQLDEAKAAKVACDERVTALQGDIAAVSAAEAATKAALAGVQTELAGATQQIKDLTGNIDGLNRELDRRDAELAEIRNQLEVQKNAVAAETAKKDELAAQITGLTKQIETLKSGASSSTDTLAAKEGEITRLKAEVRAAEEQKGGCEERITELQRTISELEAEKRRADELKEDAERELAMLRAQLTAEKAEHEKQLAVERGKLETGQRLIESQAGTIKEMEATIRSQREQLEKAQADFKGTSDKVADTAKEIASVKAQLTAAQAEVERLKGSTAGEIGAAKTAAATEVARIQEELKGLQAKLAACEEDKKKAAEAAAAAAAAAQARINELSATLAQKGDVAASAQGEVEGAKAAAAAAGAQNQELAAKLAALETQLAALQAQLGAKGSEAAEASAKAAAAEGQASAASQYLTKLQGIAQRSLNKDWTVGADPDLQTFEKLLLAVKSAPEAAGAAGAKGIGIANSVCFFSYFILFFLKSVFFTGKTAEDNAYRQQTFNWLDGLVTRMMAGKGEKDYFEALTAIFTLLYSAEAHFLMKFDHIADPALDINTDDIGLTVVKFDMGGGGASVGSKQIIRTLFDTLAADPNQVALTDYIDQSVNSTFYTILPQLPNLFFHPPQPNKPAKSATTPELLPYDYPSFTYFPNDLKDMTSPVLRTRFQVLNANDSYTETTHQVSSPGDIKPVFDTLFSDNFENMKKTHILTYQTLFSVFIVMGRRYLLLAEKLLESKQCKIPDVLKEEGLRQLGERSKAVAAAVGQGRAAKAATEAAEKKRAQDELDAARRQAAQAQQDAASARGQLQGIGAQMAAMEADRAARQQAAPPRSTSPPPAGAQAPAPAPAGFNTKTSVLRTGDSLLTRYSTRRAGAEEVNTYRAQVIQYANVQFPKGISGRRDAESAVDYFNNKFGTMPGIRPIGIVGGRYA